METIQSVCIGIVILCAIGFAISVVVGMLSIKFDWEIDDTCFGIAFCCIVIMFSTGIVGAVTSGSKGE